MTIAELRGVRTIVLLSNAFSFARNIIEVVDFLKLGGSGACSPRKFFNFSISEAVSGGF